MVIASLSAASRIHLDFRSRAVGCGGGMAHADMAGFFSQEITYGRCVKMTA